MTLQSASNSKMLCMELMLSSDVAEVATEKLKLDSIVDKSLETLS